VSDEERNAGSRGLAAGELLELLGTFNDLLANPEANEILAEFIRGKIRSIVNDPATAEALCPTTYHFGTKRPCLDTELLRDVQPAARAPGRPAQARRSPRSPRPASTRRPASRSSSTPSSSPPGFDAMTGAIVGVDITGKDGLTLKEKWAARAAHLPRPHHRRVPQPLHDHRPGQPVGAVEHDRVDRAARRLDHRHARSSCAPTASTTIEPTPTAEAGWVQHVNDCADITLFPQANSWYMGANVPGKPRVFLPYVGGVDRYRGICDEVVSRTTSASSAGPGRRVQRRRRPPPAARRAGARDDGRARTCRPSRDDGGRGPGVHGSHGRR
jgi:cation diffusion facilitator CzcD-associated flavoprotein CzcO